MVPGVDPASILTGLNYFFLDFLNGKLYYKSLQDGFKEFICYWEAQKIQYILKLEHEIGHPGITKMKSLINLKYYGISSAEITKYVNRCIVYKRYNPISTVQNINQIIADHKYQRYQMDCIDLTYAKELNERKSYVLTVIDCYTKYAWCFPHKEKTEANVESHLKYIFMNFGQPEILHSDNGKEFENKNVKELCRNFGVSFFHERTRHPQS